jgi:hypothetical protein
MPIFILAAVGIIAALTACFALLRWQKPGYIALWQIAGGSLILAALLISYFQDSTAYLDGLFYVTSFATAVLAIFAGGLLWRGKARGITLSIVAQVLQLAWVSVPAIQFGSTLGPTIGPRITESTISFDVGFYGRAGVLQVPGYAFPLDITLNMLPVLALIALIRLRRDSLRGSGLTNG